MRYVLESVHFGAAQLTIVQGVGFATHQVAQQVNVVLLTILFVSMKAAVHLVIQRFVVPTAAVQMLFVAMEKTAA